MKKLIEQIRAFLLVSPKIKKVRSKKTGASIEWKSVQMAEGYYVYRKKGKSGEWIRIAETKKTEYLDTTAKSGKGYRYNITAYRGKTESVANTENSRFIRYLSTPKPRGIIWTPKKGVTVKWIKVKGAKGYYVYRKTKKGEWKKLGDVSADKAKGKKNNHYSFVDRTAKANKTYSYSVRAYSGKAKSARASKGFKIKTK